MCFLRDKFSSSKTLRNLILLIFSTSWLFIFNVGRGKGMLYFLHDLSENEKLVFPTFSDNLLAENSSYFDESVYDYIYPAGSLPSRLYGTPKLHKIKQKSCCIVN